MRLALQSGPGGLGTVTVIAAFQQGYNAPIKRGLHTSSGKKSPTTTTTANSALAIAPGTNA